MSPSYSTEADRLLARAVRSGLTETRHEGGVVAVRGGEVVGSWGETTTPFFYRSAIKPFQAHVSQELGADLVPEQLAIASASHGGHPVHLAYVRQMLEGAGFDEDALLCPPAWPLNGARQRVHAAGHRRPRRVFHNCSGKHAAMLRASRARGWPTDSYGDRDHPLQQRVLELVADVTGEVAVPVGIDGCGIPTLRGSLRGLATAFAKLSSEPRFGEIRAAVSRFPALAGDNLRPDGRLGAWWGGPVKVGAAGLVAAGRGGLGIAAKSFEGSSAMALVGLVEALRQLGALSPAMLDGLATVARPDVLGGGRAVGSVEPALSAGPASNRDPVPTG